MFTSAFVRMPFAVQLALTRGCRASTRATNATSKSLCVIRRPSFSTCTAIFSRASFNAPASTSRTTKKCGTVVQLWAVRSAIKRPIALIIVPGSGKAAAFAPEAAVSMSEARISPPAPEPRTCPKSTFSSFASRRALGEIFAAVAGRTTAVSEAGVCASVRIVCLPDCTATSSTGTASPGFSIQAIVFPTGISAPASALTPLSTPSPGDSISMTALSVSISSRGSPLRTGSPSFFSQLMSLPVSCAISRAGMTTLIGIIVGEGRKPVSLLP